ncbi:hypothetical protein GO491_10715 [Flavobacteriaceae bacterium Ap0902]|nr:hypothetical protein [Flavobacteriaceae bacterium Ap0902]
MRKIIFILFLVFTFVRAQDAGDLVHSELKLDISPGGLINWIDENSEQEIDPNFIAFVENIPYGLQGYKLTYKSQDYDNNLVNSTGMVLFPKTNRKLSTVLYMSPTTETRDAVPSEMSGSGGVGFVLPVLISMAEYIVIAPDYLGMGDGDGQLAYMEDKTAAAAGIDMLKAANQFLNQLGKTRYDEYFVGGYSQGGHAAMAVVRANQMLRNPFPIKYLAAGAGPYDMSDTTMHIGLFDEETYPNAALVAYVIHTCQNIGFPQFQNDWHEVISDEYYTRFEAAVLNGEGGLEWAPRVWREMFQPSYIEDIESNNEHPALLCLRTNDVYDFNNQTPTGMFSSWFDKTIPPENDKKTKKIQRAYYNRWDLGKFKIRTHTLGPWNHTLGSIPYTLAAIYKFNTQRQGGFFNSFASSTNEYARVMEEEVKLTFVQSTVDPEVIAEKTALNQKRINEKSYKTLQTLKAVNEEVSLIKVQLPNGKERVFPFLKEEAIDLEAKDVLSLKGDKWELDMSQWPDDLTIIHLIENNEIIDTRTVPSGEKIISLNRKEISNIDFIEIVAGATVFKVKLPEQPDIPTVSRLNIVNKNTYAYVLAPKPLRTIEVYDMAGSLVKSIHGKAFKQLEFPLAKGMYIVHGIYMSGEKEGVKFIKN